MTAASPLLDSVRLSRTVWVARVSPEPGPPPPLSAAQLAGKEAAVSGSLDDECWNGLVAEALEAYRQETPVRQITARYGLNKEQILALVDEAGYARHEEMVQARRVKRALPVNS